MADGKTLVFTNAKRANPPSCLQEQLYVAIEEYEENIHNEKWQVLMSVVVPFDYAQDERQQGTSHPHMFDFSPKCRKTGHQ